MNKKEYERFKALRTKVANGTATFAERNFLKRTEKRRKKLKNQSNQHHPNGDK